MGSNQELCIWAKEPLNRKQFMSETSNSGKCPDVGRSWTLETEPTPTMLLEQHYSLLHSKSSPHITEKHNFRPYSRSLLFIESHTGHNAEISRSQEAQPQLIHQHPSFWFPDSGSIVEEGQKDPKSQNTRKPAGRHGCKSKARTMPCNFIKYSIDNLSNVE